MRNSTVAATLVLIALLARPQITFAQATTDTIRGTWDGLKAIPPGDELVVGLRSGQTIKGRLSSISDSILAIAHDKKTTDITRRDVLKVYRLISKSAKRSTLIGLGIGAAVGGTAGGAADASTSDPSGFGFLILGTIGVGVGALTGYIIGSRKHRVLIYETR